MRQSEDRWLLGGLPMSLIRPAAGELPASESAWAGQEGAKLTAHYAAAKSEYSASTCSRRGGIASTNKA
jgi:hypothetical protein